MLPFSFFWRFTGGPCGLFSYGGADLVSPDGWDGWLTAGRLWPTFGSRSSVVGGSSGLPGNLSSSAPIDLCAFASPTEGLWLATAIRSRGLTRSKGNAGSATTGNICEDCECGGARGRVPDGEVKKDTSVCRKNEFRHNSDVHMNSTYFTHKHPGPGILNDLSPVIITPFKRRGVPQNEKRRPCASKGDIHSPSILKENMRFYLSFVASENEYLTGSRCFVFLALHERKIR